MITNFKSYNKKYSRSKRDKFKADEKQARIQHKKNLNAMTPATIDQLNYLYYLGYKGDYTTITKSQASYHIDRLLKEKEANKDNSKR